MVYNIKDSTILLKGDVMLDNRTITFLTVCKEMNYTRAAEKLNISQPAVSQHIQYMEGLLWSQAFSLHRQKADPDRRRKAAAAFPYSPPQ